MQYPVTELFHSIQGEGANAGRSAWFIRLAGCSFQCPGCDEPLHEDVTKIQRMTEEEIVAQMDTPSDIVVITGGEPTLHDLGPLTAAIKRHCSSWTVASCREVLVCLETNGTGAIRGDFDFVCVAPKPLAFAKNKTAGYNLATFMRANEIRLVVGWHDDQNVERLILQYAEALPQVQIYLSPLTMFPGNLLIPETAARAVELVKKHPQTRLSLQTHKWLMIR